MYTDNIHKTNTSSPNRLSGNPHTGEVSLIHMCGIHQLLQTLELFGSQSAAHISNTRQVATTLLDILQSSSCPAKKVTVSVREYVENTGKKLDNHCHHRQHQHHHPPNVASMDLYESSS
jgi:hypothetical protein